MGGWLSAGVSNQNGTPPPTWRRARTSRTGRSTLGANLSRAISGDTRGDNRFNGGGYARFDTGILPARSQRQQLRRRLR
ncbi:hypothetical protein M8494_17920 [Serratia ureilytica]